MTNHIRVERLTRQLALAGVVLIALSLLTGGLAAGALTGMFRADGHTTLAAHLTALMGAFYVFGFAWSLPFIKFQTSGLIRLAWAITLPQFANWALTAFKAFWFVHGINLNADPQNNFIFALLNALVVLPLLVATAFWAFGLARTAPTAD